MLNAQGKYIAFLDADDAWLPDKLKMQVEYLERNNNLGLVYTDVYILNNRRFTASKQGGVRCFQRRPPFRGKVCQELFLDNPIMTSSVLMRKDCFEKTGLFKPLLSPIEDYDIWLRTAVFYEMDFIDIPLVKYRDYTGTFNKNVILTLTNIINTLNGFLTDYPAVANLLGKKAKQRVALHYVMLGKRYLLRADFRKAFYNFNLAQRLTKSIVLPFYIFFSSFFDCLMIIPRYFKNLIYKVMPGIG
ncbi:MAG: glycosyltransferase [Candidatus Omnitrophica bacterium]|nr:glycosyltransferase [Candidatus Omnitrophota bacterium]